MAGMTTELKEFSQNGNSVTYMTASHALDKVELVLLSRRVPAGNQTVARSSVTVLQGTVDDNGLPMASKISLGVTIAIPLGGQSADVSSALTILRDYVASDDFQALIDNQSPLPTVDAFS